MHRVELRDRLAELSGRLGLGVRKTAFDLLRSPRTCGRQLLRVARLELLKLLRVGRLERLVRRKGRREGVPVRRRLGLGFRGLGLCFGERLFESRRVGLGLGERAFERRDARRKVADGRLSVGERSGEHDLVGLERGDLRLKVRGLALGTRVRFGDGRLRAGERLARGRERRLESHNLGFLGRERDLRFGERLFGGRKGRHRRGELARRVIESQQCPPN